MAQSVRLMMALAIFLSYGLQFYVPMNIMGPWFRNLFTGEYAQNLSDSALRIGLIIFTCKLHIFNSCMSWILNKILICIFFCLNSSYFGCFGTESRSNHFAGRFIKFINACIDCAAAHWNCNIWPESDGPILLEIVERFGNYAVWNFGLLLWFICKYYGAAESNTASINIKHKYKLIQFYLITMESFF